MSPKDRWEKKKTIFECTKICIEIIIAVLILIFTHVYNRRNLENANANLQLAKSNSELAQTQIKVSLVPYLSSQNPAQRMMALHLSEALDRCFALDMGSVQSLYDSDSTVRGNAQLMLFGFSKREPDSLKRRANESMQKVSVMNELRFKKLLPALESARAYSAGGNASGREKSVELYREITGMLSIGARKSLDANLLSRAEKAYDEGQFDNAVQYYEALYSEYRR
jgi:hypothetical protein